jgi:type II secretion system protein G
MEAQMHATNRSHTTSGFTLIELMIVVVVIGLLVAIAMPNFISMQNRAREGTVKSNMHTVQMSMEDFSLLNDGQYPTSAAATVPDGRTLQQVCPTSGYPTNPWSKVPSIVQWNTNPTAGAKGELAINPALASWYQVKGNGANGDTLSLVLTSGQ